MFAGVKCLFVEGGVHRARLEVWRRKISERGGSVFSCADPQHPLTLVLASDEDHLRRWRTTPAARALQGVPAVKYEWVERCLQSGQRLPFDSLRIGSQPHSYSQLEPQPLSKGTVAPSAPASASASSEGILTRGHAGSKRASSAAERECHVTEGSVGGPHEKVHRTGEDRRRPGSQGMRSTDPGAGRQQEDPSSVSLADGASTVQDPPHRPSPPHKDDGVTSPSQGMGSAYPGASGCKEFSGESPRTVGMWGSSTSEAELANAENAPCALEPGHNGCHYALCGLAPNGSAHNAQKHPSTLGQPHIPPHVGPTADRVLSVQEQRFWWREIFEGALWGASEKERATIQARAREGGPWGDLGPLGSKAALSSSPSLSLSLPPSLSLPQELTACVPSQGNPSRRDPPQSSCPSMGLQSGAHHAHAPADRETHAHAPLSDHCLSSSSDGPSPEGGCKYHPHCPSTASTGLYTPPDLNRHITGPFAELRTIYKEGLGEEWRALSYSKAVSVLEKVPLRVSAVEQLEGLPGLGKSLLDQVGEILRAGLPRRLMALRADERARTLTLFGAVWGIGPGSAKRLYDMGHRQLGDLEREPSLAPAQRVGLRFHKDICTRIPRADVERMEALVQVEAQVVCAGVSVLCAGSFRRGKATVGDMDLVATHSDGKSHVGFLKKLVGRLRIVGFITEELGVGHHLKGTEKPGQINKVDSFFGLCKDPLRGLYHRIDIKVFPKAIYSFGLLAWTGNDILNRRLRELASLQGVVLDDKGMKLKEGHSFVKHRLGAADPQDFDLQTLSDESDIFEFFGCPYLEPCRRNL